jgi:hypothetical protein
MHNETPRDEATVLDTLDPVKRMGRNEDVNQNERDVVSNGSA